LFINSARSLSIIIRRLLSTEEEQGETYASSHNNSSVDNLRE
jgi:hypothetical protein